MCTLEKKQGARDPDMPPCKKQRQDDTVTPFPFLRLPGDIQQHILKFTHVIDRSHMRCAISARQSAASGCSDLHKAQSREFDQKLVVLMYAIRKYPPGFFDIDEIGKNVTNLFIESYDPSTGLCDTAFRDIMDAYPAVRTNIDHIKTNIDETFHSRRGPMHKTILPKDIKFKMEEDDTFIPSDTELFMFLQELDVWNGTDWVWNKIRELSFVYKLKPQSFEKCTSLIVRMIPQEKKDDIKGIISKEGLFDMIYYGNECLLRDILDDKKDRGENYFYSLDLMKIVYDYQFHLLTFSRVILQRFLHYYGNVLGRTTPVQLFYMFEHSIKTARLPSAFTLARHFEQHHMRKDA